MLTSNTERLLTTLVELVGPRSAYQVFRSVREHKAEGVSGEVLAVVALVPSEETEAASRYLRALLRETDELGDL